MAFIDGKSSAEVLDANLKITSDEDIIKDFREKWEANDSDDLIRFQYALVLCKSPLSVDKMESVIHFEYLIGKALFLRDSLYNLAVVKYSLGEFHSARACCEELFRQEPDNTQVARLHAAISYKQQVQEKQTKDTQDAATAGIAVGLAVAAVGVGLAFLLKKK